MHIWSEPSFKQMANQPFSAGFHDICFAMWSNWIVNRSRKSCYTSIWKKKMVKKELLIEISKLESIMVSDTEHMNLWTVQQWKNQQILTPDMNELTAKMPTNDELFILKLTARIFSSQLRLRILGVPCNLYLYRGMSFLSLKYKTKKKVKLYHIRFQSIEWNKSRTFQFVAQWMSNYSCAVFSSNDQ